MSQNLVAVVWYIVGTIFILGLFFLFLRFFFQRLRRNANKQIAKMEMAMRMAAPQVLYGAKETLRGVGFDFFGKEMIKLPENFWECLDIELMANTLRTCCKIVSRLSPDRENEEKHLIACSFWLAKLLLYKSNSQPAKAMAILADICSRDQKIAPFLIDYLVKASINCAPQVIWEPAE